MRSSKNDCGTFADNTIRNRYSRVKETNLRPFFIFCSNVSYRFWRRPIRLSRNSKWYFSISVGLMDEFVYFTRRRNCLLFLTLGFISFSFYFDMSTCRSKNKNTFRMVTNLQDVSPSDKGQITVLYLECFSCWFQILVRFFSIHNPF